MRGKYWMLHNIAPCGSIILYIVGLRISARRSTAGEATPLEKDALTPKPGSPIMMVPKANRLATYKYLFNFRPVHFSHVPYSSERAGGMINMT